VFDHVTIRVADRQASERFYAAVLRAVGIAQTYSGEGFAEWDDFSLAPADPEHPVTRRLHAGFAAPSRDAVDAFCGRAATPAPATAAHPARGRGTGTTTTAASSSTPTATASRRCTTP
jgi:catechol 2,3-dioxygenase-like lactoylglutathione lyase family enzyme